MNRKRNRTYKSWKFHRRKDGRWGWMFKASPVRSSNFSDIENSPKGIDEIQKLVGEAGLAAASEAKALGIPKVFARDNKIIREYSDGRIEILIPVERVSNRKYFRHLKSGILHAREK